MPYPFLFLEVIFQFYFTLYHKVSGGYDYPKIMSPGLKMTQENLTGSKIILEKSYPSPSHC